MKILIPLILLVFVLAGCTSEVHLEQKEAIEFCEERNLDFIFTGYDAKLQPITLCYDKQHETFREFLT